MIKLPRDHTDAEELANITDHVLPGYRIDRNPFVWNTKLAGKWAEHVKVMPDGKPYDLSMAQNFDRLPKHYIWMWRRREFHGRGVEIDFAVIAYMRLGNGYSVRMWKDVDDFWPHFVWLMEKAPGPCACMRCKSENELDGVEESVEEVQKARAISEGRGVPAANGGEAWSSESKKEFDTQSVKLAREDSMALFAI